MVYAVAVALFAMTTLAMVAPLPSVGVWTAADVRFVWVWACSGGLVAVVLWTDHKRRALHTQLRDVQRSDRDAERDLTAVYSDVGVLNRRIAIVRTAQRTVMRAAQAERVCDSVAQVAQQLLRTEAVAVYVVDASDRVCATSAQAVALRTPVRALRPYTSVPTQRKTHIPVRAIVRGRRMRLVVCAREEVRGAAYDDRADALLTMVLYTAILRAEDLCARGRCCTLGGE